MRIEKEKDEIDKAEILLRCLKLKRGLFYIRETYYV